VELADKVVVISGGASGIGRACARAMAGLGARVAVVDINEAGAAEVAREIGAGAIAIGCDVADEAQVSEMVAKTEHSLGHVDILFNNAGVDTGGDPLVTPIEVWQQQWDINLMAHIYAIRAVLPSMLERGSGYILHTASMAGILTTHTNLTYAAIKHAVVGVAEWMSISYHDKGIRTSLLAPLGVRTPMFDTESKFAMEAAGPISEPEEVAQQVIDAIKEERFLILTDPLAQVWMDRKAADLERWLVGMRRLQLKLEAQ
jgi:NAD(P)-dependent dehydrogenase (short-subunit alcohol dehydrogenase family)